MTHTSPYGASRAPAAATAVFRGTRACRQQRLALIATACSVTDNNLQDDEFAARAANAIILLEQQY